ncbi:MAG: tRNA (adenosine(37)-N6)-dimethylallyltransferase MiaA [Candidatus Doudnabacteria bacterium RIFCSPLOWO2_01_FULL_44_21]|uniref:tRNA dimethylallyltransferase n=1 Tax=Candidatus Doudnabacteria bacterium RIFCSPLOWO2_01_FULL_44_21 TaxID=1817841 RepID=A0A1F5PXU1_9BACT|nr:MAG: tRNA (adenosine(37)-N6)-dimethylallyltransferase MiaA [Candidatus Doudnabacteria bacterium RIFCSPHIGHO2_02_FULL_43_13b]OGE94736.1 MAG: tRNA (adenosine(37)-N6)-dimethylallyltransferase MiaA [Candidatus Doudnabacteria bacterium RIFCSPLOWO2_01_FULL_44_21]
MARSKLIVILGPTSSGKSALAIQLARKFKGEIISADSRQVYKGMDIGTGKVSKKEQKLVLHHLLDVASPKKQFTVAHFKPLAQKAIKQILAKKKLPFLVGGTPFYIYATIDDLQIPEVQPNLKLRSKLRSKTATELFAMLKKLDPRRAKNIDRHNPHRLIRAIEIIKATGLPVPLFRHPEFISGSQDQIPKQVRNDVLILGIQKSPEELRKLIDKRLKQRLNAGMIAEVKGLLSAKGGSASGGKNKISHKRLQAMGLEYRFVSLYLQGKLTYNQMVEQLKHAIHKFSKRQMTWFKTDSRIKWIKNHKQAEKLVRQYLARDN